MNLFHSFSKSLRRDVTHGSQHGDSSMLQFRLTTSLEVLDAPVSCEPGRVPKSGRSLHTQVVIQACVLIGRKIYTCVLLLRAIFIASWWNIKTNTSIIKPCHKMSQVFWLFLPGLPTRSRRHAKERQCSWPSRPMHCQSSRPALQSTNFFVLSYKCYHNVVWNTH